MAKKKAADYSEKLAPYGYVEGTDVNEFLAQFGFNPDEQSVDEFLKSHFNID